MKILFIGDIVGSPGREIVADRLADIVQSRQIDLVIANGENSASGFGITPRIAEQLFAAGVEVIDRAEITSGTAKRFSNTSRSIPAW